MTALFRIVIASGAKQSMRQREWIAASLRSSQ
jgi:hypothetical protein